MNIDRAVKVAAVGAAAVAGATGSLAFLEARRVSAETAALIAEAREALLTDPRGLRGTTANLNAALVQVGLTADVWRTTSIEQRRSLETASSAAATAMVNIAKTTKRLDSAIVSIESATKEKLRSKDDQVDRAATAVVRSAEAVEPLLKELTATSSKMTQSLEVLRSAAESDRMNRMARNSEILMEQLTKTSESLSSASSHVEQALRPQPKKPFVRRLWYLVFNR